MEFNNVVSIIACIYQRKARNKKWSSHKAKEKKKHTMRYHLTSIRMFIVKKTRDNILARM